MILAPGNRVRSRLAQRAGDWGRHAAFWLTLVVLSLSPIFAQAEDVRLESGFTSREAAVGDQIQYQIQITGARRAVKVPTIQVEGLDIRLADSQERMEVQFGTGGLSQVSKMTYVYTVNPQRAGSFTVPALEVQAGGKTIFTEPATLKVTERGVIPPGGVDRLGFAEIIPEKKTAYVGEAIPVEVRLYIDSQVRYRLEQMPTLEAEAFTKQKFDQMRSSTETRDGRTYEVAYAKTVLTPTKAGKLTIGPAEFNYIAQIPRATRRRPSAFGNSILEEMMGDPMGGFGQMEQKKTLSEKVEIEVKPLPTAGRPPSFAGAVGDFRIAADPAPARVKIGDPLTMRVRVSGAGNFDRVNAPELAEPEGWRAYPPTPSFQADDEFGLRGTKTFEVAVIPEAKKTAAPVFEFAYFDPASGQYKTKRTTASPLAVEGEVPPPPVATTSSGAASASGPASSTPAPATPAPPPTDILGIRYDLGTLTPATPLYTQRGFLLAQLVPAGLLLGLVAVRFWPRRRGYRQLTRLRHEREQLLTGWRKEETRQGFFAKGVRLLQIDAALRTGQPPESLDARAIARMHPGEPKAQAAMEEIFETHAHALYAGGGGAMEEAIPREERHRIINAVTPLLQRK